MDQPHPRPLEHLLDHEDPGIRLVHDWVATAELECEVLPPPDNRAEVLVPLQVTTRSTLGAIAYETGGLLVDGGWLRILGAGHPRLTRTLTLRSDLLLVADDAAGGFFALNGGALGEDVGSLYYWPPDDLDWERMEIGYSSFVQWSLTERLGMFYADLRWTGWREDVRALSADRCYSFHPWLWTEQGGVETSHRGDVPVQEAFDVKVDIVRQLVGE